MRETFSTHRKSDVDPKRDRMQSQGHPKTSVTGGKNNTIDLNQVKPPARKTIEEEMN